MFYRNLLPPFFSLSTSRFFRVHGRPFLRTLNPLLSSSSLTFHLIMPTSCSPLIPRKINQLSERKRVPVNYPRYRLLSVALWKRFSVTRRKKTALGVGCCTWSTQFAIVCGCVVWTLLSRIRITKIGATRFRFVCVWWYYFPVAYRGSGMRYVECHPTHHGPLVGGRVGAPENLKFFNYMYFLYAGK